MFSQKCGKFQNWKIISFLNFKHYKNFLLFEGYDPAHYSSRLHSSEERCIELHITYPTGTTAEDTTWWGFKAFNFPFCISSAVMGFLKILLSRKDFKMTESRGLLLKSHIPFHLQTSLSLSYLHHNLMSQEKLNRKNEKGNLLRYALHYQFVFR